MRNVIDFSRKNRASSTVFGSTRKSTSKNVDIQSPSIDVREQALKASLDRADKNKW